MRARTLLRALGAPALTLAVLAPLGLAQSSNRAVTGVQFEPGSAPGLVDVHVKMALQVAGGGVETDFGTVIDVFAEGHLVASGEFDLTVKQVGGCGMPPCGGGCTALVNGVHTPGECWHVVQPCGCDVDLEALPDLPDCAIHPGDHVTIVARPAAGAAVDFVTNDDSFDGVFDGYYGCEVLSVDTVSVSVSNGGSQVFGLNAPEHPNDLYLVLGSASGTSPGFPLTPKHLLPLNVDSYTLATLELVGTQVYSGTLGVLDGGGRASGSINVPGNLGPGLVGLVLNHAAITFDLLTGLVTSATNAVPLELTAP